MTYYLTIPSDKVSISKAREYFKSFCDKKAKINFYPSEEEALFFRNEEEESITLLKAEVDCGARILRQDNSWLVTMTQGFVERNCMIWE